MRRAFNYFAKPAANRASASASASSAAAAQIPINVAKRSFMMVQRHALPAGMFAPKMNNSLIEKYIQERQFSVALKDESSYIKYTHGRPIADDFKNDTHAEVYHRSITDKEGFFDEQAQHIHWFKKYTQIIDKSDKYMQRWFPDGETSLAYNCLDRHVHEGHGDRVCFYEDSVYTGKQRAWTYSEVLEESGKLATVMKEQFGIKPGDRVVLYMPMIIESAFTMLACARIGAVHSVVFGGFSPKELANRIDDCQPKLVVTSSCGIEPNKHLKYPPIVDEALSQHCKLEGAKDIPRLIK